MHPFVNFAARGVPLYLEKELLATLAAGALPAPEEEEDEEEEDEDDEQVEPRGAEAVQDGDRPGRARAASRWAPPARAVARARGAWRARALAPEKPRLGARLRTRGASSSSWRS